MRLSCRRSDRCDCCSVFQTRRDWLPCRYPTIANAPYRLAAAKRKHDLPNKSGRHLRVRAK